MNYLTAQEVADRLRFNRETVLRWLRVGRLKGLQVGGRNDWRVTEAELERFIKESQPVKTRKFGLRSQII